MSCDFDHAGPVETCGCDCGCDAEIHHLSAYYVCWACANGDHDPPYDSPRWYDEEGDYDA